MSHLQETSPSRSTYALLAGALGIVNVFGIRGLVVLSLFTMSYREGVATFEGVLASGDLWNYLLGRLPVVAVYAFIIAALAMVLTKASGAPTAVIRRVVAIQFGAYVGVFLYLRLQTLL